MGTVRVVVVGRTSGLLLLYRAGNALTCLDARRMVNRIAMTAGCRHITPRGLRRTFCTACLGSGVPMCDMQTEMRHADPRTTVLCDMAKNNKDRHAGHRVLSFRAGMTSSRCSLAGEGTFRAFGSVRRTAGAPGRRLATVRVILAGLRTRVLADPTCVSSVQQRRDQHAEDVVGVVGERPTSACHQQVVQLRTGDGPQHVPSAAGVQAHA